MSLDQIWADLDPKRRAALQRTLNSSGAGSVLLQPNVNKIVQQLSLRMLGVQSTLDRKPGSGQAALINRRTPGTTGGAWVADTDSGTEETGTYAQSTFTYRTLLTKGTVTRKLQATGRTYGDVLATEMVNKSEDFANLLESALITGDNTANANQINGLLTLINAVSGQVVANSTLSAGSALVLSKLDEAIDVVRGAGNRADLRIYGSQAGLRKLNAALQAQQQFVNMTEIAGGFRVKTYDGIPLVPTTSMPDTLTWSGSSQTVFSGGATTSLVIVNTRYCWIEELTPMSVLPLAKTTSQNDAFEMFVDLALVLANSKGASILGGISV
jgi:hypothetical protein